MAKRQRAYSEKDIAERLKALSGWEITKKGTTLSKTFSVSNFVSGLAFAAKIAVHAEILGHHPDIGLSYDKVKISLTTHDAGGLTKKDFELAARIDRLKAI